MPYPPIDFDQYISSLDSFLRQHHREGGGPIFNPLILAIVWCSYAVNILYYLFDTVTYTTFTGAV